MELANSQMPKFADARGVFQDEIGDVLGKQGGRKIRGNLFDRP